MSTQNDVRLPDTNKLIVSNSPHVHDRPDVRKIMLTVVAALVPACISAVIFFGLRALWILAVTTVSCLVFEYLFSRLFHRPPSLLDGSALLTGVLLALNLSAATPWWVCVVGALLAIGLGKMLYGGLGYNPFNPALVGRVGLLIAFPGIMTTWVKPEPGKLVYDAVTTATPLGELGTNGIIGTDYASYFLGNIGGCLGETSALALLIGAIPLVWKRLIRWQVPVFYIGTVAVISGVMHGINPEAYAPAGFHVLTGGLMLGAIYMATDMVTSPMNPRGAVVFAVGCGIITSVIRIWGSYPEGVSFAIIFMNALVPLIDRYTVYQPFGATREKKVKAAEAV